MAGKGITIKVKGIVQTQAFLKRLAIEKQTKLSQAIKDEGNLMIAEVMDSIAGFRTEPTSVDTGQFKSSVGLDSVFIEPYTFLVQSNLEYAEYLEKGTKRIKPGRRHFEMSKDRRKDKIKDSIQRALL